MASKLIDICSYVKEKVSVSKLTTQTYISTENMLPNKSGITTATNLPSVEYTQAFRKNDVLVSNIRPYFKKIWHAEYDGGCSNDVLVFRAAEGIDSTFLYYVLSDDTFFNYATATSKGTKMPRGDKGAILKYGVPDVDVDVQYKIGSLLRSIDKKIAVNSKINDNLEQQIQGLFDTLFADKIARVDQLCHKLLGELVETIDNRGKTPPLEAAATDYPIIDVRALSGESRIIDYNNCTKYVSDSTYVSWFRSGHPKLLDILISTVGSLAEMKMFFGTKGCIAQNVVGFRAKNISPYYLYQYLTTIKSELVSYNIGSVQPSIKVTHIIKHPVYIPAEDEINQFDSFATSATDTIYKNNLESEYLASIRDTLLPKLMSGEIDVTGIQI